MRAGEVLKTKICMDEMMIAEAKTLCERLIPCGPITVQLIRDNQGVDWFIEINPRFGGGAPLSMKAGARSAEIILRLLDGEKVKYCSNIGNGAIYSRFDQSVCITEWKSEIKGVIFDLDDTLYNEKEYVKSGYKAVAEYLGDVSIADRLWKEFISGKSAFDEVLNQLKKMDDLQKCIRIYQEHKPTLNLNDGAKELVKSLKERNIKIGIITDGRPNGQRNKIEALGLSGLDYIITDELGGIQFRKPCDIAFRIMARRWKLDNENVVYIGDNLNKDFQAPKQLGMKIIWFDNKDGLYRNENMCNIVENRICNLKEAYNFI